MRPTPQHNQPKIALCGVSSFFLDGQKTLSYGVETNDGGSISLSVKVPYHPDDREADRLGRIELRKLLATLAAAA